MYKKIELVLKTLQTGEDALWVDSDIVFFENVIPELQSYAGDCIFQNDGWAPCCGFFFARNTEYTKQLLSSILNTIHTNIQTRTRFKSFPVFDDETSLSMLLKKNKVKAKITLLPRDTYPNGEWFYVKKMKCNPKMIHNNFANSMDEKILRFQQQGLWNPDPSLLETTKRIYIQ